MNLKRLIRALIILSLPLSSTVTLLSCVVPKQKYDNDAESSIIPPTLIKPKIKEDNPRNEMDTLLSLLNLYLNRKKKEDLKDDYNNLKDDLAKIDLKKIVSKMVSPILSMLAKVPISAKEILAKIKEANLKDFTTAFEGFLTSKITILKDGKFINVEPKELFKSDYLKWLSSQKSLYKKKIEKEVFDYKTYKEKLIKDKSGINSIINTQFKIFSDYYYWKWREYVDSTKLLNAYLNGGQYEELWHKELLEPLLNKLKDNDNFENYQFRIASDYSGLYGYWTQIEYRASDSEKWSVYGTRGSNTKNKKNNEILRKRTEEKYLNILKNEGKINSFHYFHFDTASGKSGVYDKTKIERIYKNVKSTIENINKNWSIKNEKLLDSDEFTSNLIEKWGADNKEEAIKKLDQKYHSENMEFFSIFIDRRIQSFTSEKLANALKIEKFVSVDVGNFDAEPKVDVEGLKNNIFKNNNLVYIISSILSIIKVTILDKKIDEPITKITGIDFTKIINKLKYWFNPEGFSKRFTDEIFAKLYPFLKDIKIKLINVPLLGTSIVSLENLHTRSGSILVSIAGLIGKIPNVERLLNKEIEKLLPKINEHLNKVDVSEVSKYFDGIDIIKLSSVITKMNEKGTSLIDILKDINNLFNINDGSLEQWIILINKLLSYLKQILLNVSSLDLKDKKDFFSVIESIIKMVVDEKYHSSINEVFGYFLNPNLFNLKYIDLIDLLGRIVINIIKLSDKKDLSVEEFLEIYRDINKITGSDKEISNDLLEELEKIIRDKKSELDLFSFDIILGIIKARFKK